MNTARLFNLLLSIVALFAVVMSSYLILMILASFGADPVRALLFTSGLAAVELTLMSMAAYLVKILY